VEKLKQRLLFAEFSVGGAAMIEAEFIEFLTAATVLYLIVMVIR